ncbi:PAS domain-containing protein [Streptomyces sp. NPDC014894]|uniref:PAS domain-containing protein n=1 Tax=Streptomyces sp. NPDC014894 TaxID=3364931 RepID=UPI0036F4D235
MSSRPSRGAARLAAILDALPDGLVLVNCNGTVVNANTIALGLFETPGTALVGRGLLDLLPAFDSRLIPGSMRSPDPAMERIRTKPTRMMARRTDGSEFPAEVTSASLEDGREAYASSGGYTGDELLMLVVRDLSGTMDTEAELARSRRQTEMILRAAAEGVVGTDTEGRVVLVNPAAAQILGFRASDLGGQELHPLILHSREDGKPFPYAESPLADTLRSGRKHRVRGQVLWAKNGKRVPVDLTTAPVRDGDQLVGAVMTFTDRRPGEELAARHAAELAEVTERFTAELAETTERFTAELADKSERYSVEIEERDERHQELSARHDQLTAVLGESLRGPLEELRTELGTLVADPAGQLWPEANQVLHYLAAGYSRMTTLIDNVLGFQRLDTGRERLTKSKVLLDGVVAAGIEGAVELIGPGRAQFAVHAPSIEAEVDAARLATALAHLAADVAGVDSTGKARLLPDGGRGDSTVVVAAAQRGEVVRIEVRGPFAGGDPVHEPIVRGIVQAHGGVLQTHDVPGTSGSAYVLEVPLGEGAGAVQLPAAAPGRGSAIAPAAPGARQAPGARPGVHRPAAHPGAPALPPVGPGPVAPPLVPPVVPPAAAPQAPVPQAPAPQAASPAQPPPVTAAPAAGGDDQVTGAVVLPEQRVSPGAADSAPGPVPGPAPEPSHEQTSPEQGVAPAGAESGVGSGTEQAAESEAAGSGRRRARRGSTDAFLESPLSGQRAAEESGQPAPTPTGRRRASAPQDEQQNDEPGAAQDSGGTQGGGGGTGRRRGRPSPAEESAGAAGPGVPAEGSVVTAAEGATGRPALGQAVPPQGVPPQGMGQQGMGQQHGVGQQQAVPPHGMGQPGMGQPGIGQPGMGQQAVPPQGIPQQQAVPPHGLGAEAGGQRPARTGLPELSAGQPSEAANTAGRRARRALAPAPAPAEEAEAGRGVFALPPAEADRSPRTPGAVDASVPGQHDAVRTEPGDDHHTPPQHHPEPTGRRRALGEEPPGVRIADEAAAGAQPTVRGTGQGPSTGSVSLPLPPLEPPAPGSTGSHTIAQPLPAEAPLPADASHGRAFSVRTLGQGVPFAQQVADQQDQPGQPGQPGQPQQAQGQGQAQGSQGGQTSLGSGRRRKLSTPPDVERPDGERPEQSARPHPQGQPGAPGPRLPVERGELGDRAEGRSYAIGAPDEGAEGPEPLDGPGGAVEVANQPQPQPVDDELPPEPLDNPRRLLVWPAPDVSTQQALSDRGYRPVVVHSREEVDAQIAAFPAALFVDPLTGPITRTALQSLRQAAVAAEVPVLVTAGLGQATREAAYGADPAILLKALAPRDSEQHPPRVLLIEEHEEIALALTTTLERRGMQVARAGADTDAVALAAQTRPNLVVMDLMQVRRRRAGIIDWLRANGRLNRTPLVVYTSAGLNRAELPRLSSGETVLFLAERSTSGEVQSRIVDLLAKIGTN